MFFYCDAKIRALSRINGIKHNLPPHDSVESHWVDEFNAAVQKIEKACEIELEEYKVPTNMLKRRPASGNYLTGEIEYSTELYCDRSVLLRKVDSALEYLNQIELIEVITTDISKETSQEKLKLFISHSSKDITIVQLRVDILSAALKLGARQIRCTSVDGYRLQCGTNTLEQLRREVHEAQVFLGIISQASLKSMYVSFELGARWGAEKHLLPILTPNTDSSILSGPLSGINALRCDNAAQLHQLVKDLLMDLKTLFLSRIIRIIQKVLVF